MDTLCISFVPGRWHESDGRSRGHEIREGLRSTKRPDSPRDGHLSLLRAQHERSWHLVSFARGSENDSDRARPYRVTEQTDRRERREDRGGNSCKNFFCLLSSSCHSLSSSRDCIIFPLGVEAEYVQSSGRRNGASQSRFVSGDVGDGDGRLRETVGKSTRQSTLGNLLRKG